MMVHSNVCTYVCMYVMFVYVYVKACFLYVSMHGGLKSVKVMNTRIYCMRYVCMFFYELCFCFLSGNMSNVSFAFQTWRANRQFRSLLK
jgi:hypothetical protein